MSQAAFYLRLKEMEKDNV
ncbi:MULTISPECIES: hypothetical protein [Lysinibacillus]|nr:hypothetical protein [Lysinibacillus sp. G01H]WDU81889.1 hypothetical protein PSR12_10475 [Lysinibacillus sp. G01H]